MNIEYTKVEDYLLPNLVIGNKNYEQINKYGYLRLDYIKNDEKLSEKYKENNQIEWVQLMNNYKNMAEEIILRELIYV